MRSRAFLRWHQGVETAEVSSQAPNKFNEINRLDKLLKTKQINILYVWLTLSDQIAILVE
jgi:polyphosphate kinase 2 (PPK2 family)